jgi:hypothetical protein
MIQQKLLSLDLRCTFIFSPRYLYTDKQKLNFNQFKEVIKILGIFLDITNYILNNKMFK